LRGWWSIRRLVTGVGAGLGGGAGAAAVLVSVRFAIGPSGCGPVVEASAAVCRRGVFVGA
jgi:hypothetical protein